ncbi:universal stress protein [Marinirhabdus gelatinilytica]|uniref:Nucleotide-binding universal stress UspA family protein n=1 Tax=Marinirhabdus gelatinilytica TaxID=1703343 RepID=A0A370QLE6_9FLAO|nr:universal stress protein [Marinirhabdus gelatinilytica]RDK89195.1 nucleotide-binding universal stress UspA family protein [Marinirhabdus gelatinilytica]
MKNIIIPVDFSKQSEFALKAGAIIAKKHSSKLYVLHMLELSDSILTRTDTENTNKMFFLLSLAKKKFEDFLDKDYLKGIEVDPIVKHYKVYNEVDEVSRAVDADLIIMGSKGLTAQDGLFAGSNAEKMVRNSSTPVLIIKSEPNNFDLKNVVYAASLEPESIPAFKKATTLFSSLGSNVHPVFVNRPNNGFISSREFNEKVKAFATAGGTDNVEFIAGYTVEDGLIQYAEETKADIIAVSTNARKGLNHFLMGSISEDLANHSKLPVMSFKL